MVFTNISAMPVLYGNARIEEIYANSRINSEKVRVVVGTCACIIHVLQPSTLSSWSHWPRGPVDLKSYWPPGKSTGPHFPPTDVYIRD